MPCILHWDQNHFVVLYRVKKGRKFYVADPGKGPMTYGKEEFCLYKGKTVVVVAHRLSHAATEAAAGETAAASP